MGFTLTEAIVAIAIFSGIVISTAPVLQTTLKVSARITANVESKERLRATNNLIRSRLERLVNPGLRNGEYSFYGSPSNISFLSINRTYADPEFVKIDIASREGGNFIEMVVDPVYSENQKSLPSVLMGSLSEVRFSFYGNLNGEAALDWVNEWNYQSPPDIVALEGVINVDGVRHERFRLEFSVGGKSPFICVFDNISRKCRGQS